MKYLAILLLTAASWFCLLLARADTAFHHQSPTRAIELIPSNAEYLSQQALQLDYDGLDSTPLLEHIAELTPLSSAPRLRLGLAAEVRGDFATAERWLLDASKVDHQFEPRWTLANYYFRRANSTGFWKWMRAALEVSYGDRTPAFDLCSKMSHDPAETYAKAVSGSHEVTEAYLVYLLDQHRPAAAVPVALALASDPNDRPMLLSLCDALLDARDSTSAQTLWRAMGYPQPSGILNRDFQQPVGHGFDWRITDIVGATHIALETPPSHRIELNGKQPELCELLRQTMVLEPNTRYVLRWESRTRSVTAGLAWRIENQHAPVQPSEDWLQGQLAFTATSGLATLAFEYQRPSGEPRAQGSVELRHVSIDVAGQLSHY